MTYHAEIIAVGTELLLGNIANTDAQMLSQSLSTLGVNVFWHTVVGDNPQRLREALDIARHRADIILTTGGLGPTYDDLTKQTICAAFGQKLVLHEDILEDIRAFYQSALHVPMPENNTQQAELPEGCAFAPRCPYATGACRTRKPEMTGVGGTQMVRCLAHQGVFESPELMEEVRHGR